MNLFFDESGDFKAGVSMSQQGEAYQVEMPSGKRTKVRAKDVLLQFCYTGSCRIHDGCASDCSERLIWIFLWEVAGQDEVLVLRNWVPNILVMLPKPA